MARSLWFGDKLSFASLIFLTAALAVTIWKPGDAAAQSRCRPKPMLVSEVLAEAKATAHLLPASGPQARLFIKIAALQARSGDVQGAFRTLDAIESYRDSPINLHMSAEDQRRNGFGDMLKALAASGQGALAIRIADDPPAAYRTHRDYGLGTIALQLAEHQDSRGAKEAIRRMTNSQLPYDYAQQVAIYLDDKAMGRELTKFYVRSANEFAEFFVIERSVGLILGHQHIPEKLPGDQAIPEIGFTLAFLLWCEDSEAAQRYLAYMTKVFDIPQETLDELNEAVKDTSLNLRVEMPTRPKLPAPISAQLALSRANAQILAARKLDNPEDRATALLNGAEMLLDLPRQTGCKCCCHRGITRPGITRPRRLARLGMCH